MSRYLILVVINTPLIIAGILSAVVSFRLKKSSNKRFIFRLSLWLGIFLGLLLSEPIYNFLFSNQLTTTEPLSLFDVIQITGIILTLFVANRAYSKAEYLESRLQSMHRDLSIRLSEEDSRK